MTSNGAATRFFIIAAPRTGSNMLCTLLGSHPDVLCHHELFNPNGIFYALPLRDGTFSLGTMADRDRDPLAFLPRIWSATLGHSHVGFKMTRGQSAEVIESLLGDSGVHTIVLRRGNRLRTYVSELRARATDTWEVYDPSQLAVAPPLVHVQPDAFITHIADNEKFFADVETSVARSGAPVLRLCYEELLQPNAQDRLLSFLSLDPAFPLTATSVRQNPLDLRESVENYAELAAALHGTDLERELT